MEIGFIQVKTLLLLILIIPLTLFFYRQLEIKEWRLSILKTKGPQRKKILLTFWIVSLGLLIFASARPYSGFEDVQIQGAGSDIILAVDISRSMLTRDVAPSRIDFAKRKVIDIIDLISKTRSGDRLGLVLFAGDSYLLCPLTSDYSALKLFARSISEGLITTPGSAINKAVESALEAFQSTKSTNPSILIISDGEDDSLNIDNAVSLSKKSSIPINIIGIGTLDGKPIEVSPGVFIKSEKGDIVISKLNEASLQEISQKTGGHYLRSTLTDRDISILFPPTSIPEIPKSLRDKIVVKNNNSHTIRIYNEIGPIIVWVVLAGAVIFLILVDKRAVLFLIPLLLIFSSNIRAEENKEEIPNKIPSLRESYELYNQGKFKEALPGFDAANKESPEDLRVIQSLGSTYYKLGKYDEAETLFKKLTESSKSGRDRFSGEYNLGNSRFFKKDYEGAIKNFEEALKIKKGDKNTEFNLELAKKLLEEQKNQEKQDKNKEQDKDKKKDQEKQDNEQKKDKDPQKPENEQDKDKGQEKDEERSKNEQKDQEEKDDKKKEQDKEQDTENDKEEGQKAENKKQEANKDNRTLPEKEADAWLENLPESPVLLMRKRGDPNQNGQTW